MRANRVGSLIFAGLFLVLLAAAAAGLVRAEPPRIYAITHARLVAAPGRVIEGGTIVIRDGLIEAVGQGLEAPADAYVIDGTGKTVTAGFIDACTGIGQKSEPQEPPAGKAGGRQGMPEESKTPPGPVHPNSRIRPERKVVDSLVAEAMQFEKHREMGFTSALTLPSTGIFRGQAALINLGDGSPSEMIVNGSVAQVIAFERGRFGQGYPTSLMGSIAAVRQTLRDARRHDIWAKRYEADPTGIKRPEYVPALQRLEGAVAGSETVLFDITDSSDVSRALEITSEFSLDAVLIGAGLESLQTGLLDALVASGAGVILPLAYPDKPKVDDPDEALGVSRRKLEEWDAAPENPARVHAAGIPFALGTCRLERPKEFPANLRKAVERGLPADAALAALTVTPARFFGVGGSLGTLEAGKIANVTVFDAPEEDGGVFHEKAKVTHLFVDGVKFEIEQKKTKGDPDAVVDPRGTWSITFTAGGRTTTRVWKIEGEKGAYTGTAETGSGTADFTSVSLAGNVMTVVMPAREGRPSQELVVVITGEKLEGEGDLANGMSYAIKGARTSRPDGGVK